MLYLHATKEQDMTTTARPYSVRKQSSGYAASVKWIVVKNPGARRVSVHAEHTREAALAHAEQLNDSNEQHLNNLADPAWVAARDAAIADFQAAEDARTAAFEAVIARQAARRAQEA
jgi:hypothetical protein